MDYRISTITPCFKMKKYLKGWLEELPKQTIFDQIQVVLDHNEPDEEEIKWVQEFQEKYPGRIKHIIVEKVDPIGPSMNRCILESDAPIVAIWNVDDLRSPDSLEKQCLMLENNPDIGIANGNFLYVRNFGSTMGPLIDHSKAVESEFTRGMYFGPFFDWR